MGNSQRKVMQGIIPIKTMEKKKTKTDKTTGNTGRVNITLT